MAGGVTEPPPLADPMRGTLGAQVAAGISLNGVVDSGLAAAEQSIGVIEMWLIQRSRWMESNPPSRFGGRLKYTLLIKALQFAARELEREREEMHRGHH